MRFETFNALYDQAMTHYRRGEFAAAYDLLSAEGPAFPADAPTVLYLRSCLAARLGDRAGAVAILGEALDGGHWYGEQMLRESPSWQVLQGDPAFERMAARSLEMMAAATQKPLRLLAEPAGDPPPSGWPLLMALHGNAQDARPTLAAWRLAAPGRLLVAPQSSQALSSQGFVWDDLEIAQRELLEHFAGVSAEYPVDASDVVLAGFSRGGETALHMVLSGTLPARGFVLLGPGGPMADDPSQWAPLIKAAEGRGLRGAIVLGADDEPPLVDAGLVLAPMLDQAGIPCYLEVIPGLGHAYPDDGGAALGRALAFVTQA